MCVIAIVGEKSAGLTEKQAEQMWEANSHGAGVAWREKEEKTGKILVRWEKGLELEQLQKLITEIPKPYIAHFRIPSAGGDVDALTHPFTIDKVASTELSGKTPGRVLFHNGHWGQWKAELMTAARGKGDLPLGKWSDSRAMAYMAYVYGLGVLELIDEKVVAFGPKDIEVFNASSWSKVEDLWVSNRGWENVRTTYNAGFTRGNRGKGGSDYHTTPPASMAGGKKANGGGAAESGPFTTLEQVEKAYAAGEIGRKRRNREVRKLENATRSRKARRGKNKQRYQSVH